MINSICNNNYIKSISLFIITTFPLALIIGNFAINLYLLISAIFFFIFFFSNKNKLNYNILVKYLFIILIYVCLNSVLNFSSFENFFKSFGNLRYLLFSLFICIVLGDISDKKKKIIFILNIFLVIILCLDIFHQVYFKENLLGFPPGMCDDYGNRCERYSGFFGNEFIAGAFLVQIGLLLSSLFFSKYKKYSKSNLLYLTFLIFLFISIVLTGERNAVFIFILYLFFQSFFNKKLIHFLFILFLLIFIIFILSMKFDHTNKRFLNILNSWGTNNINYSFAEKLKNNPWSLHYYNAFELYNEKPFFGHGYKSFREKCGNTNFEKNLRKKNFPYSSCSTHPHNYFIEFMIENGSIGGILYFGLLFLLYFVVIKNNDSAENIIAKNIFFLIISILFPFKPSGSFFSTFNASLLFYIFGFLFYYLNLGKKKDG